MVTEPHKLPIVGVSKYYNLTNYGDPKMVLLI